MTFSRNKNIGNLVYYKMLNLIYLLGKHLGGRGMSSVLS